MVVEGLHLDSPKLLRSEAQPQSRRLPRVNSGCHGEVTSVQLIALKRERTRHINRIRGLLASVGVRVKAHWRTLRGQ